MPRKTKLKEEDFQHFQDMVVQAIKRTTIEERLSVAREWSMGSRSNYKQFAEMREVTPAGLITAALIDAEHPMLVFDGRALFKSILEAQIIIQQAEMNGTWIMEINPQALVDRLWTGCVQVTENGKIGG